MFWVLRPPFTELEDRVYGTISSHDEGPIWHVRKCQNCGSIQEQEQIRDLPIELFGSTLEDFVWIDDPAIIIGESLANALERAGLHGFQLRPINVKAWWRLDSARQEIINWLENEQPPKLYQILITGRGGSILPKNKVRVDLNCSVCGIKIYKLLQKGIILDERQWDQSDIFVVNEFPGDPIIADKFLQLLGNENAKNYSVIRAEAFWI